MAHSKAASVTEKTTSHTDPIRPSTLENQAVAGDDVGSLRRFFPVEHFVDVRADAEQAVFAAACILEQTRFLAASAGSLMLNFGRDRSSNASRPLLAVDVKNRAADGGNGETGTRFAVSFDRAVFAFPCGPTIETIRFCPNVLPKL